MACFHSTENSGEITKIGGSQNPVITLCVDQHKEIIMSKVELSPQKIIIALESRSPKSLTDVYRILGGTGKLSGTLAAKIRAAVPYIEKTLADNKAGTAKAEGEEVSTKSKPAQKAEKKPAKAPKKSPVPHDSRNPFRPGSGYGLLVDLIASAGQKGIGKEDLLKAYCKATGKDIVHAKYDLAVINSASETSEKRHRSCADGFTILKEGDNYRIRFR